MIWEGSRESWEAAAPSFFSLYGPLLLIALAMGLIAGVVLAMGRF